MAFVASLNWMPRTYHAQHRIGIRQQPLLIWRLHRKRTQEQSKQQKQREVGFCMHVVHTHAHAHLKMHMCAAGPYQELFEHSEHAEMHGLSFCFKGLWKHKRKHANKQPAMWVSAGVRV